MRLIVFVLVFCWLVGASKALDIETTGSDGDVWIRATGVVADGDAERFELLAQVVTMPVVEIHSEGGSLVGAIELGRKIRALGFATYVPPRTECVSACVYAFLGGATRVADGALGVHQFYGTDDKETADQAQAIAIELVTDLYAYFEEMGVSPKALEIALRTPPKRLHYFSDVETETYRVTFEEAPAETASSTDYADTDWSKVPVWQPPKQ